MSLIFKIEKLLPASPEQVMHMLTEQKLIAIWSGEEVVFEAREGGKVELFGGWMKGEVQSISADELSYTWRTAEWADETADSLVHFKLKDSGEQTLLVLNHTNLPNEDEKKSQLQGWEDYFFVPLEDYLMIRYNAE